MNVYLQAKKALIVALGIAALTAGASIAAAPAANAAGANGLYTETTYQVTLKGSPVALDGKLRRTRTGKSIADITCTQGTCVTVIVTKKGVKTPAAKTLTATRAGSVKASRTRGKGTWKVRALKKVSFQTVRYYDGVPDYSPSYKPGGSSGIQAVTGNNTVTLNGVSYDANSIPPCDPRNWDSDPSNDVPADSTNSIGTGPYLCNGGDTRTQMPDYDLS